MNITSETYNKTCKRPINLSHSFENLQGNIYVPFLLLINKLRFICRIKIVWINGQKVLKYYDRSGRFRKDTHGACFFFLTKNISCDISFKGPTPHVVFPKMHLLERRWSPVLFVTFNIVISFIFPKIFIEVPQVVQKIWRFLRQYYLFLPIFRIFCHFLVTMKLKTAA